MLVGVPLEALIFIQWTRAYKLSRKRLWVQTHPTFVQLSEWELGLRYSSLLHNSNRGGPSCLLQSGCRLPWNQQVLLAEARTQHRTVTRTLASWWKSPINRTSTPARWSCSCLRVASSFVGREKSHLHQLQ